MILRIYRTYGRLSCSILRAELVAEIETDALPEDPQAFADEYGGDFIEVAPVDPERRSMSKYGMTDSGKRQSFGNGMAIRDTADDKPRPDLISPFAEERAGPLAPHGAAKYAERNWERGMPFSRCVASLKRHVMKYQQGKRDEDHLAAIMFNAMALIHYEEMIERGLLPAT